MQQNKSNQMLIQRRFYDAGAGWNRHDAGGDDCNDASDCNDVCGIWNFSLTAQDSAMFGDCCTCYDIIPFHGGGVSLKIFYKKCSSPLKK